MVPPMNNVRRKIVRGLLVGTVTVLSVGGLSACSGQTVAEVPQVKETPYPALNSAQVDQVLTEVAQTLANADKSRKADALKTRVSGAALAMRTGEYTQAAKDSGFKLTTFPQEMQSVTVTSSLDWPRAIVAFTKTEGNQVPYLLVVRQSEAAAPYRLDSWAGVFPGANVPATAVVEKGSPIVDVTRVGSRILAPKDAVVSWGGVVMDSKHADAAKFTEDELMKQIRDELSKLRTDIGDNGEVSAELKPLDDTIAIELVKGSVLAIGSFNYTVTVKAASTTRPITLAQLAPLLGDGGKFSGSATWKSTVTVAIVIPEAGGDSKAQAVAGERIITSASKS
ncbi:MAG: hypothetical protein SOS98_02840 [Varibaculum sp.]|nr:hypothetical protein [Varibaculum sp.]